MSPLLDPAWQAGARHHTYFHTPDEFSGGTIKPGYIYTASKVLGKHWQDDGFLARLRACERREAVSQLIAERDRENP